MLNLWHVPGHRRIQKDTQSQSLSPSAHKNLTIKGFLCLFVSSSSSSSSSCYSFSSSFFVRIQVNQSRVFPLLRWPHHSPHQAWLERTSWPFHTLMPLSVQKREWLIWIDTNSHCPAWPVTGHHWVVVACLNARWGRMENTQGRRPANDEAAAQLQRCRELGMHLKKKKQSWVEGLSRISSVGWKSHNINY